MGTATKKGEVATAAHEPAICKRINYSADFHTKSWSYRFECPTCGRSRRWNTNFLGSRYAVQCDGKAQSRVARPRNYED